MDRICEAYNGGMGVEFMHKTRERLHWICSQVWGTRVLDVGCSQGVVPLILARMGYAVDGIDVNPEAIAFANERLAKEPADVQSKVTYTACDFGTFVLPKNKKYDVITMSEVLEHLVRPQDFVQKAFSILPEGGRFIVTVPFGINDDPDHRQTFYLTSVHSLLHPLFEVVAVKIFNGWIGLVGQRRAAETQDPLVISPSLMRQAEEAFFRIERPLRDRTLAITSQCQEMTAQQTKLAESLRAAEKARLEAAANAAPLRSELADVRGRLVERVEQCGRLAAECESGKERVAALESELANLREALAAKAKDLSKAEERLAAETKACLKSLANADALGKQVRLQAERIKTLEDDLAGERSWTVQHRCECKAVQDRLAMAERRLEEQSKVALAAEEKRAAEERLHRKFSSEAYNLGKRVKAQEERIVALEGDLSAAKKLGKEKGKLIAERNELRRQLEKSSAAYAKLSKAKLCRLTLAYWRIKDRQKRKK